MYPSYTCHELTHTSNAATTELRCRRSQAGSFHMGQEGHRLTSQWPRCLDENNFKTNVIITIRNDFEAWMTLTKCVVILQTVLSWQCQRSARVSLVYIAILCDRGLRSPDCWHQVCNEARTQISFRFKYHGEQEDSRPSNKQEDEKATHLILWNFNLWLVIETCLKTDF